MTTNPRATLCIQNLELDVRLGWKATERKTTQKVNVDIIIQFLKTPHACHSDEINDTICYATLIQYLQAYLLDLEFLLVERLTQTIYEAVKTYLASPSHLTIKLTKWPNIPGLRDGVSFELRDVSA